MQKIMNSIVVTVNLLGEIEGRVEHTTRQRHTVILSEEFGGSMNRNIKHTDRIPTKACRMFSVAAEHVEAWVKADQCPEWETPQNWKAKSRVQRLHSHLRRFDEGYGVSYEDLGDNEN